MGVVSRLRLVAAVIGHKLLTPCAFCVCGVIWMGIRETRHRRSKMGLGDEYDLLSVTSAQVAGITVFP